MYPTRFSSRQTDTNIPRFSRHQRRDVFLILSLTNGRQMDTRANTASIFLVAITKKYHDILYRDITVILLYYCLPYNVSRETFQFYLSL